MTEENQNLKAQIHRLIAQNEIEQAFELLANSQFTHLDKELILLNNRYNKAREERRMGISSKDEADREFNQINLALIDLASRVGNKSLSFPTTPKPKNDLLLYLLPALLVVATAAFFFLQSKGNVTTSDENPSSTMDTPQLSVDNGLTKEIEGKMWNLALDQNNLESFTAYLDMFPRGEFVLQARQKVREIGEDTIWARAEKHQVIAFYEDYLDQFPDGRFVTNAREKVEELQTQEAKMLQDNQDFAAAAETNTVAAFRQYLAQHPDGAHRSLAQANIQALEAQKQCNCKARTFRVQSDHTWAEFRMPAAKGGTVVSIPKGVYNKYVLPKCNRVWWDDLQFSCDPNLCRWERISGRWDADILCHGSYTPHKYLFVGAY